MEPTTPKKEIRELMMDLLDSLPEDFSEADLIEKADQIREISCRAENSELFKSSQEQYKAFLADMENDTPENERLMCSWTWLMSRITQAPTSFHLHTAVLLCMPMVAKFLPKSSQQI